MAINTIQGYSPSTTEPIDSRLIKTNATARKAINSFDAYNGLQVFQQDTKELYVCINAADPSLDASWSKIFTAGPVTGSYTGSFSGDGSGLTNVPASSIVGISSNQISSGSTSIQTLTGSITSIVNAVTSSVSNETSTTFYTPVTGSIFSGSFVGDGSALTGISSTLAVSGSTGQGTVDLKTEALSIIGTANQIATSYSGQTLTIGLPTNVTIAGDLTVNGTTTTINTTNLLIADRFALFASGSTVATDGGIIVQSDSTGTGFALGYSSGSARWVLQSNLSGTATAFSSPPTAFVGIVQTGSIAPISNPAYGDTEGHGTIFINRSLGDIWIYA